MKVKKKNDIFVGDSSFKISHNFLVVIYRETCSVRAWYIDAVTCVDAFNIYIRPA